MEGGCKEKEGDIMDNVTLKLNLPSFISSYEKYSASPLMVEIYLICLICPA